MPGGTRRGGLIRPGRTLPALALWQRLYLRPLPHQQGSFERRAIRLISVVSYRSSHIGRFISGGSYRVARAATPGPGLHVWAQPQTGTTGAEVDHRARHVAVAALVGADAVGVPQPEQGGDAVGVHQVLGAD